MANCNDCNIRQEKAVPWAAVELLNGAHAQTVKRLWVVIIILIAALLICNGAWLYAWNQYDYEVIDESIDLSTRNGGNANFIGNDGDINNYGNDTLPQSEPNP